MSDWMKGSAAALGALVLGWACAEPVHASDFGIGIATLTHVNLSIRQDHVIAGDYAYLTGEHCATVDAWILSVNGAWIVTCDGVRENSFALSVDGEVMETGTFDDVVRTFTGPVIDGRMVDPNFIVFNYHRN